jgi:hypothetical protein
MLKIITIMLLSISASGAPVCSKYCNPMKSKPCGSACISNNNACHKSWTTACVGERPAADKQGMTPRHVDQAPKK